MLVSICIPTYNGEKYLQEALNSAKAQTYKNIEVIISDDQSIDKTVDICENFKNSVNFPVHIYSHIPSGIGANWNNSIERSSGNYIKMMFQDDIMEPKCISEMMKYITSKNVEIVVCKRSIIDNYSNLIKDGNWHKNFHDLHIPAGISVNEFYLLKKSNLKELNFNRYSVDNIIGEPCASLFSRKLFQKVGQFNTEVKQILDYEYWIRVLKKYDIGIIEEKLIKFRVHDEQTSNLNSNDNVNESKIIYNMLFQNLLFSIDRKEAISYIKRKHPLINFLYKVKYKLFS